MSNQLKSLTQLARHILTPNQGVNNPTPVPDIDRIDSDPEINPEDPFIDFDSEPTPVPAFIRIYSDPYLNLENLFSESDSDPNQVPVVDDILTPSFDIVDRVTENPIPEHSGTDIIRPASRNHIPVDEDISFAIMADQTAAGAERVFLTECIAEIDAINEADRSPRQKCALLAYRNAVDRLAPVQKLKP